MLEGIVLAVLGGVALAAIFWRLIYPIWPDLLLVGAGLALLCFALSL